MAISEAARNALHTGLSDVLGAERAETLTSAMPLHDLHEVATEPDRAFSDQRSRRRSPGCARS